MQKDELNYGELVAKYGGNTYGVTTQGEFIEKANSKIMGEVRNFIQNMSSYFLKRPTWKNWNALSTEGICNGLVQAFYLKLKYSIDKEKAIEEFAAELDNVDLSLAKKASMLQSVDSDTYVHASHNNFYKTLGLDFEEEKSFEPYENEARKIMFENLAKFLKHTPEDSGQLKKTNSDLVFNQLIDYLQKQPENDLIKITLNFSKLQKKISSEGIAGHAIYFSKMKNNNGQTLFVFYDPNKTPTIFTDEANFYTFLKIYLSQQTLIFKNGLNADQATIDLIKYAEKSDFHLIMHKLEEKIDTLINGEKNEVQKKLQILKLRCQYAEKYGMNYSPKINLKDLKIDDIDFQVIGGLIEGGRKHYSNKGLLEIIENEIEFGFESEPVIMEELLEILKGSSPSLTY